MIDFVEVGIPRDKHELMLLSDRRDPNVIFGERVPLRLQRALDSTVVFRGDFIDRQHFDCESELIDASHIR